MRNNYRSVFEKNEYPIEDNFKVLSFLIRHGLISPLYNILKAYGPSAHLLLLLHLLQ